MRNANGREEGKQGKILETPSAFLCKPFSFLLGALYFVVVGFSFCFVLI